MFKRCQYNDEEQEDKVWPAGGQKPSDEQIDAKMQNNEPRCKSSLWFVPDHYDQNMKNLHIQ